jgi:YidC/Oxa1 family membrane protein insertase
MNKKDLIPIVIIFALFLAYPQIDKHIVAKYFPAKVKPAPAAVADPVEAPSIPADTALAAPGDPAHAVEATVPAEAAVAPATEEQAPEVLTSLANELVALTLSSHGAGIVQAAILGYPSEMGSETPVTFDFSDRPAAAPIGYPGLRDRTAFDVVAATGDSVSYRKTLPNGLVLSRTLTLGAGYQVRIADRLENTSAAPVALSGHGLQAGFMANLPGEQDEKTPLLGVDTLTGSESVEYWGGKFGKWFPLENRSVQTQSVPGPDKTPVHVDWAAVKNKYFAQILTPEGGADRCFVDATCGAPVKSTFLFLFPRSSTPIAKVAARLALPDFELPAGQALEQNSTFYIGPKVYTELKANGPHQEDILQLGFWRVIGIWILKLMVWIQANIWPYSYGLAIILLTFLIRVIFWPLNHKSMVSTRHMQEVQPLIAAMKEKFKDNPQRQQQEMMAIYKEHKINPMGGCLPMLIQIPVFFALFVVLRGAIELRFSSFLWIADLSTPENLFKGVLPFPINILPIFMGVTMWIQQKLTPTSDPQQQKMMMMMPVIFTFMFYSFPSGLSLYWSVNQVLMIVQLAWMKKHHPGLPVKK